MLLYKMLKGFGRAKLELAVACKALSACLLG